MTDRRTVEPCFSARGALGTPRFVGTGCALVCVGIGAPMLFFAFLSGVLIGAERDVLIIACLAVPFAWAGFLIGLKSRHRLVCHPDRLLFETTTQYSLYEIPFSRIRHYQLSGARARFVYDAPGGGARPSVEFIAPFGRGEDMFDRIVDVVESVPEAQASPFSVRDQDSLRRVPEYENAVVFPWQLPVDSIEVRRRSRESSLLPFETTIVASHGRSRTVQITLGCLLFGEDEEPDESRPLLAVDRSSVVAGDGTTVALVKDSGHAGIHVEFSDDSQLSLDSAGRVDVDGREFASIECSSHRSNGFIDWIYRIELSETAPESLAMIALLVWICCRPIDVYSVS